MNDRAVAVLDQYDFTVNTAKKGRGVMIVETDKGIISLSEYTGRTERLLLCREVCNRVEASGFCKVDNLIPNKEGLLYVTDSDGKNYIVKKYVEGSECNVSDEKECRYIVGEIARLHQIMEFGEALGTSAGEDELSEIVSDKEMLIRDFSKRDAELNRVRSFIRKQSKKGEFELSFLKEYNYFEQNAKDAEGFLDEDCLKRLSAAVMEKGMYCHGECNQHNILLAACRGIAATHFEKCCMDIQIRDLYLFLRKILEKNNWSYTLGFSILEEYMKNRPLSGDEKRYLYARLLYPERFWKIANAYHNKRKSLPPRRQLEKLNALVQIEHARMDFLERLSKELL